MEKEELKKKVEETLKNIGCKDIIFSDGGESVMEVLFNCEEVISFKTPILGWTYSGIQLDESKRRQYKINFRKSEMVQQADSRFSLNCNSILG